MTVIKRNWVLILGLVALVAGYFALRLPNLLGQPIFADEAIYVRWAQVMRAEPTLRFVSLSDGKTPLFMWLMMPMFKLIKDPLLAGRVLSVLAGLGTLIGALAISAKFFNRRVMWWVGLLVVVTPWVVFFDRMALVDSMLAMWSVWSLFLVLWLAQTPRLDLAMILGFSLGGGIITKTPGMFQILLVPSSVVTFYQYHKTKAWWKFAGLLVVSMAIGWGIYNLLRLGPGFSSLSSRNNDYTFSPAILWQHPLDPLWPHLRDVMDWVPSLLSWPILGLVLLGLVTPLIWRRQIGVWTIWLWAVVPLGIEMALLRTFTARYILSSVVPLLILAAFGLDQLLVRVKKRRWVVIGLVGLSVLVGGLNFDWRLLRDPASAPLPREERRGYFEDWTAGNGLKSIAEYLTAQASKEYIVVGTEGFFGTLPDGLFIYLDKTPNLAVIGSTSTPSAELLESAKVRPTYFVVNRSRAMNGVANAQLLQTYPKAIGPDLAPDAMLLYQLDRPASSSAALRP